MRNRDTKVIVLHNKTNQMWTLKPIIDGEYWSAVETFIVEPQQSKNYEIVYRPLAMTQDQKKHNVGVLLTIFVFFCVSQVSCLIVFCYILILYCHQFSQEEIFAIFHS